MLEKINGCSTGGGGGGWHSTTPRWLAIRPRSKSIIMELHIFRDYKLTFHPSNFV